MSRVPPSRRPTKRRTSKVASSAQWTSSSTSSVGGSDRMSRTCRNNRSLLTPASPSSISATSGSASTSGPSTSAIVTLSQQPRRTTCASAASMRAAASVVLPTPASPPRKTSRPLPPCASPSSPSSDARKSSRSISTSIIQPRCPPAAGTGDIRGERASHRRPAPPRMRSTLPGARYRSIGTWPAPPRMQCPPRWRAAARNRAGRRDRVDHRPARWPSGSSRTQRNSGRRRPPGRGRRPITEYRARLAGRSCPVPRYRPRRPWRRMRCCASGFSPRITVHPSSRLAWRTRMPLWRRGRCCRLRTWSFPSGHYRDFARHGHEPWPPADGSWCQAEMGQVGERPHGLGQEHKRERLPRAHMAPGAEGEDRSVRSADIERTGFLVAGRVAVRGPDDGQHVRALGNEQPPYLGVTHAPAGQPEREVSIPSQMLPDNLGQHAGVRPAHFHDRRAADRLKDDHAERGQHARKAAVYGRAGIDDLARRHAEVVHDLHGAGDERRLLTAPLDEGSAELVYLSARLVDVVVAG